MERKYGEELKPLFGTVTSVSKFKCGLVEGDILFYIGNVMNKTTFGCFFFPISANKHNFKKYSTSIIDSHQTPYDYGSIMHYSSRAFSKNGKPTIAVANGVSCKQTRLCIYSR